MRIAQISIKNFRGISEASLRLPKHVVLIGDNNSGKSTLIEAIDLVLGPDRINRPGSIDEHDFYAGRYLNADGSPIPIEVEVIIVGLSPEQVRHFKGNLEFWDDDAGALVTGPPIELIEKPTVEEALRVGFRGWYEPNDDDFKTQTFFCSPHQDDGPQSPFWTSDKRICGFLLLRALRTGSRALSLERGSLLDIILRVHELRPKMWEKVLEQLRVLTVADDPALGVTQILSGVQAAIRAFVPTEWASEPHLRVSDLTRENLRRTLTVFMATGAMNGQTPHAAPFQHQGNGTINMLVLALLSMIADAKQTVIFAMEEPEIAIPPATQKRIVDGVRSKSAQALFTSHSPYVLEEFSPSEILALRRDAEGPPRHGGSRNLIHNAMPRWKRLALRSSMQRRTTKLRAMGSSFATSEKQCLQSTTSRPILCKSWLLRLPLIIHSNRRPKASRHCCLMKLPNRLFAVLLQGW